MRFFWQICLNWTLYFFYLGNEKGESTTEELESMRSAVTELRRARSEAEERARVLVSAVVY